MRIIYAGGLLFYYYVVVIVFSHCYFIYSPSFCSDYPRLTTMAAEAAQRHPTPSTFRHARCRCHEICFFREAPFMQRGECARNDACSAQARGACRRREMLRRRVRSAVRAWRRVSARGGREAARAQARGRKDGAAMAAAARSESAHECMRACAQSEVRVAARRRGSRHMR